MCWQPEISKQVFRRMAELVGVLDVVDSDDSPLPIHFYS